MLGVDSDRVRLLLRLMLVSARIIRHVWTRDCYLCWEKRRSQGIQSNQSMRLVRIQPNFRSVYQYEQQCMSRRWARLTDSRSHFGNLMVAVMLRST